LNVTSTIFDGSTSYKSYKQVGSNRVEQIIKRRCRYRGPTIQTIDCCIEQRELGHGNKKTSLLETLTSWPHSLKRSVRIQNQKQNRKIDIYHAPDDHLPRFVLIRGSRGPPKQEKNVFQSTMKPTKIVVEGGSLATTKVSVVVDIYFSSSEWSLISQCMIL
jgi:hypothetical protein